MRYTNGSVRKWLRGGSQIAMVVGLCHATAALAQQAQEPADALSADELENGSGELDPNSGIVVTGTRIAREGFDAPTPTVVIGEAELRQGNRPNVAMVLNDLPQFRSTQTAASTVGNTINSSFSPDLRGLLFFRTLVLVDGRRFVGGGFAGNPDLNQIPPSLVKRIDVVTGGASAAWGSGAVAGVVNIILDDDLEGLTVGAKSGVSSRGDAASYGGELTYGAKFADDRGHFMFAGEYFRDRGAFNRGSGVRPNLDSGLFTTSTGQLLLANDINLTTASVGGTITSGPGAGLIFNPDGSLSPISRGSQSNTNSTLGGSGNSRTDFIAVTSPYERLNTFGRASFEVSPAAILWLEGSFSRVYSQFLFPVDIQEATATSGFVISSSNPFLSPAARTLLSGSPTFRLGRIFADVPRAGRTYRSERNVFEIAGGINGSLGGSWTYRAHASHGEQRSNESIGNQRITANFNSAIDAVVNPANGQIVCRAALTNPTSACVPINLFGQGNISPQALAYAFGQAQGITTTELDAASASISGDPLSLWAGPISVTLGIDWRREGYKTNFIDPLSAASAFTGTNFAPRAGEFSVKEAFGEVAIPILDVPDSIKIELNGAARYSDYSTTGGIWSWKGGATARLFNDLLLRGTYSRDIRSPWIFDLFAPRLTNFSTITDPFRNNESVNVTFYRGGNPDLEPEIAHTLTVGGSYSPRWAPGLRVSIDYYDIDITDAIGTILPQDAVTQCFNGNTAVCATIERDADGRITTVFSNNFNFQALKTRGVEFEAAYLMPLPSGANLRFRGLATYVDTLQFDNGLTTVEFAGDVGDGRNFTVPKWKINGSVTYQDEALGADLRVRYVGGGNYNSTLNIINNEMPSRVYVDVGAQVKVGKYEIYGSVNNVFDSKPPLGAASSTVYDIIGTYYSGGVRLKF